MTQAPPVLGVGLSKVLGEKPLPDCSQSSFDLFHIVELLVRFSCGHGEGTGKIFTV